MRYKLLVLLLLCVTTAPAQRKKKVVARKPRTSAMSVGNKLYETLLPSTAKVMFIDSVVVDKNRFLQAVPLNKESGSITLRPVEYPLIQYQNELGDRIVYADGDTASTMLKTQTLLGNSWGPASTLTDIDEKEYLLQNYPFLAADGITLFFSAEGQQSVGGRDIFMTTYDSDKHSWLKPQNYGLPFNSPANDYLLAIDDLDTLGWLVTDRRQPQDKVCIYTFVPTSARQNFEADDLSNATLRSYANIMCIKDTWGFGDRQAALSRIRAMKERQKARQNEAGMSFVVNDSRVVNSPEQFRSDESRRLYQQMVELRQMITTEENNLDKLRQQYESDAAARPSLRQPILKVEQTLLKQKRDLKVLEKKIRNIENTYKN